jgi:hypothetical protein
MTDLEVRQGVLDAIGESIDQLGHALAALGVAYELLDERSADRLEDELFGPVQKAYGRAKRTYADFAARYQLAPATFDQPTSSSGSRDIRRFLDTAVEAVDEAEEILIHLQDSGQTVDYGDAELRAGVAGVRELVGNVRASARLFIRTLGR